MKNQTERKVILAQKIVDKSLDIILFFVSILFLGVGVYALIDNRLVIHDAGIPDSFKQSAIADREYPSVTELQKTNPDIVAWLTLDNTPVDYPITQAANNSKYLTIDYKGEHFIGGNPFVDYRNRFLHDDYTIIYGHRMNQGKMFGSLVEYADASYMQKHLSGTITTEDGTRQLEVIAYIVEDITNTTIYNLADNRIQSNGDILTSISTKAVTVNGKYTREYLRSEEAGQWQLLLLSTCDKNSRRYRDLLLLRIGDYV